MKIAITGTMASGKSTCSNILRKHGYYVFDSDLYAKACYKKSHPAYDDIIGLLKESILQKDGEINLKEVSKIIFNDELIKKELESIIHPYIKKELLKKMKKYDVFIAEIPLLFEVEWQSLFDHVLLVVSSRENIIDRCIKYRGYSESEAIDRLNSQLDINYKIERSSYVLYNDKTIDEFENQVLRWMKEMNLV